MSVFIFNREKTSDLLFKEPGVEIVNPKTMHAGKLINKKINNLVTLVHTWNKTN